MFNIIWKVYFAIHNVNYVMIAPCQVKCHRRYYRTLTSHRLNFIRSLYTIPFLRFTILSSIICCWAPFTLCYVFNMVNFLFKACRRKFCPIYSKVWWKLSDVEDLLNTICLHILKWKTIINNISTTMSLLLGRYASHKF